MPKERQYPAQGHTGLELSPLAAGPALPAPDPKNRLKSSPWPEGGECGCYMACACQHVPKFLRGHSLGVH